MNSKAKKPKSPEPLPESEDRWVHERAAVAGGVFRVAGVDEAGRGPLAGPVVAAAVVFPPKMRRCPPSSDFALLDDSKRLTPARRHRLLQALKARADIAIGLGILEPRDIDRWNILGATHRAMALALRALDPPADFALVDGLPVPGLPCDSLSLVKGDRRCPSISAASIVAKETRDALMRDLHRDYPQYGFDRHKGYGTRQHLEALRHHGPCPAHRLGFKPVRDALEQANTPGASHNW